jgi:CRP-like cAMP-binding protein
MPADTGNPELALTPQATVGSTPSDLRCHQCLGRSLNICKALDNSGLAELLGMGAPMRWRKGEVVFRAGDVQGYFFKVTKGIVAVSGGLRDGRRQILTLRVPGDVAGYLEKDGKYAFEGEALTDAEACAFDRRRFDKLVARTPALAAAVAEALADALIHSGQRLTIIARLNSIERLAHFLADLCTLYEQRQMLTMPLALHLHRNEIADYLGVSRETISRSFAKLKKRNVITGTTHGHMVILDPVKLRAIAMQ